MSRRRRSRQRRSPTSRPWSGPRRGERLPDRARRHREVPHADRVGDLRGRGPGIESGTSPPPSWSGPSAEAWPTTRCGRVIDALLRNDLILVDELGFAPLDDTGAQLLFRLVADAYERRSLGIASHWPFESWGRFLPEHTTAVRMLDRLLHHCHTVVTDGDSYRMKQARANGGTRLKTS